MRQRWLTGPAVLTVAAILTASAACGGDGGANRTPVLTGAPTSGRESTPGAQATPAANAASTTPAISGSTGTNATFTLGVASGDVTSTSAVVWTRAEGAGAVEAEIARDASFKTYGSTQASTSAERDFTVKALFGGLAAGTTYYYRFFARGAFSPIGTFTTAPAETTSRPLRFVFGGDSDGVRNAAGAPTYNNFEVLDAAAAEHPAFFLYFGDTIYADRDPVASTLAGYRSKYRENRSYPALTRLLAQTSTYNTWDDHEVVNDFAGKTVDRAMFEAGRQAFREYMPIDDSAGDPATMYRAFRWGNDVDLIALDERSFRDGSASAACAGDALPGVLAPGVPPIYRAGRAILKLPDAIPPACLDTLNDPARTMLGAQQKAFLKQRLKSSTATWKVIVNEVAIQQIEAQPYDRWEGYAAERRELLSFIRDNGIKNVVFLTTDFHGTIFGPVRIDLFADPAPVAYEAIVGPIATFTTKRELSFTFGEAAANAFGPLLTNVIQVDCNELESYAYGLVDVDPAAGTMTITSKDASGSDLCKKQLKAE